MAKNCCPLCQAEKISEWKHEDDICYVCKCVSCGAWQIILKHHGEPTENELEHLKSVSLQVFPDKKWRGFRRLIFDHWHEHFV